MEFDWNAGGLAEGMRCYRARQFFEAHEHWEGVWLQSAEPSKTFLQALIQVTAAFHHLERGNRTGAVSLLTRALHRLEAFPGMYGGVPVEDLRAALRAWLNVLRQEPLPPGWTAPVILP